jgi:hypothetical protein
MKLQATDEALVALLGRHDQAVSARIAAMCIELGSRTAPLLVRTLSEGSPKARFWAARILGEIMSGARRHWLGLQDAEAESAGAFVRWHDRNDAATAPPKPPPRRDLARSAPTPRKRLAGSATGEAASLPKR